MGIVELEMKTWVLWTTYELWCKNRGLHKDELINFENFIKETQNIVLK